MTRLGDKIPVNPLDELRVARIEQRVLAAVDTSGRPHATRWWAPLRWAVPMVAVAGVALAVFLNWRASQTNAAAEVADLPAMPSAIETGDDGARLDLGGAVVAIGARARVELVRERGGGITLSLDEGRVECEVEPRDERPPFVVHAGEVDVTVVGTVFSVERHGDQVKVEVTRGKVSVVSGGKEEKVAAGEEWGAEEGEGGGVKVAEEKRGTGTGTGSEAEGQVKVAEEKRGTGTGTGSEAEGQAKVAEEKRGTGAGTGSEAESGSAVAARPKAKPTAAASHEPSSQPTVGASGCGRAPAELEHLRKQEATDPAAAAKAYLVNIAAKQQKAVASYALCQRAYLQFHRLGDARAAAATADMYRRRFPKGRERQAVLWIRVKALCNEGVTGECRAAAHTYLELFPRSRHAAEARRITDQ